MLFWVQKLKLKYRYNQSVMIVLELEQNLEQNQKFVLHVEALAKSECSKGFSLFNKHAEHAEEQAKLFLSTVQHAQEKEPLKK